MTLGEGASLPCLPRFFERFLDMLVLLPGFWIGPRGGGASDTPRRCPADVAWNLGGCSPIGRLTHVGHCAARCHVFRSRSSARTIRCRADLREVPCPHNIAQPLQLVVVEVAGCAEERPTIAHGHAKARRVDGPHASDILEVARQPFWKPSSSAGDSSTADLGLEKHVGVSRQDHQQQDHCAGHSDHHQCVHDLRILSDRAGFCTAT